MWRWVGMVVGLAIGCGPTAPEGDGGESSGGGTASPTSGAAGPTSDGTMESGTGSGSGSASSGGTTEADAPTTSTSGDPGASSGAESSSGGPRTCEELTEQVDCILADGCFSIDGQQYQPADGCEGAFKFLGCITARQCSADWISVCRDGTDEQYQVHKGCIPSGFTACDVGDAKLCGECDVPEAECTAANGCMRVTGAPLAEKNGEACWDTADPQYVGCITAEMPCDEPEEEVEVVCLQGQPDQPYLMVEHCVLAGIGFCNPFPQGAEPCR